MSSTLRESGPTRFSAHTPPENGLAGLQAYREWKQSRETAIQLFESLTRREQQVAVLVALGLTNDAMARFMEISHKTVEKHRTNMYRKLGVTDMSFVAGLITVSGLLKHPLRHHSSSHRHASWTTLITPECHELLFSPGKRLRHLAR